MFLRIEEAPQVSAAIAKSLETVVPSPEILHSWKEIARYLDRGVRTAQRWEGLGLPIHRPHGRGRSAVFAVRSELDGWMKSCPTEKYEHEDIVITTALGRDSETAAVVTESRRLRASIVDSRAQLREAIGRLVQTLGKMALPPPTATNDPSEY